MSTQKTLGQIQLGKNRITESFIEGLKKQFTTHKNIKISVLRNLTRNKKEIKKLSEEILEKLGKNYTARVIGFTIIIKKWRRDVR